MSDWQMAQMLSNATGLDLENTCSNILGARIRANNRTIRNADDLNAALNKSPFQPLSKSCLPGVSAKDFVDMATKNFGMTSSEATAVFARETGRDLESVAHEVSCPDLKPFNGVFSAPSMTSLGRPSEAFAGHPTRANESPVGTFLPPQTNCGARRHDVDGTYLMRTVMENATSGDSTLRRARRDALQQLGEGGCSRELVKIVEQLVTSGDGDARDTRRKALEMVGPDAADGLFRIVMDYITSGDGDARETRRTALRKLGEYGCTEKLLYIIRNYVTSGDGDARESRRAALDMLRANATDDLSRIVMDYATSGDSDARETRRKAIEKLGQFRSYSALRHIADRLAGSGDSDAIETRRLALELC
jgi:hypothetical protein